MFSWPNENSIKEEAKKILSSVVSLKKKPKPIDPVAIVISENLLKFIVNNSPNLLTGREKYALIENLDFLVRLTQK